MKQDLKDKIKEYSRMILWSKDEEAEAFLIENHSLNKFIRNYKERKLRVIKKEDSFKRVDLTIRLIMLQGEIPRNHVNILSKEFYEFNPNPEDLIEKYNQLTINGLSSIASVGVLCYEAILPEDRPFLKLDSVITNYQVLQSAYIGDNFENLELIELGYFIRLKRFLKKGERKEFVLGLRAAENSD